MFRNSYLIYAKSQNHCANYKVAWHWEKAQQDAYEELKRLVTTAPVLKLYDVTKDITLQVDSSKEGLGAVLLQDNQPVLYASKSLNDTQARYAVIEREMLAICYACQRFHQYVFGKSITVQTDHKPLSGILDKPLHTSVMPSTSLLAC